MTLKLDLPDINNSASHANELENVLISLRNQIEGKYDNYIKVPITTSFSQNSNGENLLVYAVYLSFVGKSNFSYRLIELICQNPDGGLPVDVYAFNGPPEEMGTAQSTDELNKIIEDVFANSRTRNIILNNYKF